MSAIRILTPWKPPAEDVLAAWRPFADEAGEVDWKLNVEWVDPWTSEDGTEYPGFHHWFVSHEETCSDGRTHAFMLDCPSAPLGPELWSHFLEFADLGWQDYLERAGVAA